MAIDGKRLAESLRSAGISLRLGWSSETLDEVLAEVEQSDLERERDRLEQVLSVQWALLKPDIREKLQQTDIAVVASQRCVAYCQKFKNDACVIVISHGIINLLAATIYDHYMQAEIPGDVGDIYLTESESVSIPKMVSMMTILIEAQYVKTQTALPDFSACLGEEALSMCRDSIHGALLFLILHELGHIELGHLDSDHGPRLTPLHGILEEENNHYKNQEQEADQFALDAIEERVRVFGSYWKSQALAFYSSYELVSGKRSESHPLALNRAAFFDPDLMNLDDQKYQNRAVAKGFTENERTAFLHGNKLIHTPHETAFTLLKLCFDLVKLNEGPDLTGCTKKTQDNWLHSELADPNPDYLNEHS